MASHLGYEGFGSILLFERWMVKGLEASLCEERKLELINFNGGVR
jgi:hypothetical protein